MKIGRNDSCPCGSGKKYKHCCLQAAAQTSGSPEVLLWRRIRRALEGVHARILRFTEEVYGREVSEEAWRGFRFDEYDPESPADSPYMGIFASLFLHRWAPDADTRIEDESLRGRSPTSTYLERRGTRLEPIVRRYLERCAAAPFSFLEILHIESGHGFRCRDVLTGAEWSVTEPDAAGHVESGDVLFGQLIDADDIVMLEAASPVMLPPIDKLDVMDLRKRIGAYGSAWPQAALREWEREIVELYLRLASRILNPERLELNDENDDLEWEDEDDEELLEPAEEAEEELAELKEELERLLIDHCDEWIASKLAALGDRTPLEAVADPEGRERVEAMLAQFERGPMEVRGDILLRLRERLGLRAPSE